MPRMPRPPNPLAGRRDRDRLQGCRGSLREPSKPRTRPFGGPVAESRIRVKLGGQEAFVLRRTRQAEPGQLTLGEPEVSRLRQWREPEDEADRKRARDRERALRARRRNAKAWWLK